MPYKKYIIKISSIIIIPYIAVIIVLFFSQKSLLYYPSKSDFADCTTFSKDEHKTYNNTRFYEEEGENNNVIVFFHGNAGAACSRSFIKGLLEKTKSSIIFVEYSGYSDPNNKEPNKNDILKDVENIKEYLYNRNYENIYVMGRSIGSGPASYLASITDTKKLLLISPYSQLYKVAADKYPIFPIKYLFTENYNSEEYLKNYKNEVLIFHGKSDNVVPYIYGRELYNTLNTQKKLFVDLDDGTHHNVFNYSEVNEKIVDFFG